AQALRTLLAHNQHLKPTFATDPDILEADVARNIYLTINGGSISLAQEREAPDGAQRDYKDRFFSEVLIQEPTQCIQGHYLELARARIWAANMHNICPAGGHHIGNLSVDNELQHEIQGFKRTRQEHEELIARQRLLVLNNASLQ